MDFQSKTQVLWTNLSQIFMRQLDNKQKWLAFSFLKSKSGGFVNYMWAPVINPDTKKNEYIWPQHVDFSIEKRSG